MKHIGFLLLIAVSIIVPSQALAFTPHQNFLISTKASKPNILMILDDSESMVTSKINGQYKVEIMRPVVYNLINRFGDSSYLGFSALGNGFSANTYRLKHRLYNETVGQLLSRHIPQASLINGQIRYTLASPISDTSKKENRAKLIERLDLFTDKGLDHTLYKYFVYGGTPIANSLYNASLYFRNLPIYLGDNHSGRHVSYGEVDGSNNPLFRVHYRCQSNHIILLTDGEGNDSFLNGYRISLTRASGKAIRLDQQDYNSYGGDLINALSYDDYAGVISNVAKFMWNKIDLKTEAKKLSATDDAGKSWDAYGSQPTMPITTHGIAFLDPSLSSAEKKAMLIQLEAATKYSGGAVASANDQAELEAAFNKIFAEIVGVVSAGNTVQDQDVPSKETLLYATFFNPINWTGELRAYEYNTSTKKFNKESNYLWSTKTKIVANQGVLKTYGNTTNLTSIGLNSAQVRWLKGENVTGYRLRSNVLADIGNAKMAYHVNDRVNVNVGKFNKKIYDRFFAYTLLKTKHVSSNLVVVGSNDGLINFIVANKGNYDKALVGTRKVTYFPSFLKGELDNLMSATNYKHRFLIDGHTNFFDAYIEKSSSAGKFKTLGLTATGAGSSRFSGDSSNIIGSGIIGYELFSISEDGSNISNNIIPTFEITDRTSGFSDLGYTYSNFEFFNQSNGSESRAVAVFGNGFGKPKSVVYVINANTGEKLTEVNLGNTGGAGTPSVVVETDINTGFHKMTSLYVGDYNGNLHRIKFKDSYDISADSTHIVYKTNEVQPIAVKPTTAKVQGKRWVYFGTGMAATLEDIDSNFNTENYFYAVIDDGSSRVVTLDQLKKFTQQETGMKPGAEAHLQDVYTTDSVANADTLNYGWVFPLGRKNSNLEGERLIHPAAINSGGYIHFVTWAFKPGEDGDPCMPNSSHGRTLYLNLNNGNSGNLDGKSGKSGSYNSEASSGVSSGPFMDIYGEDSGGGAGFRNSYTREEYDLIGVGSNSSMSADDEVLWVDTGKTTVENNASFSDDKGGSGGQNLGDYNLFSNNNDKDDNHKKTGRIYFKRGY